MCFRLKIQTLCSGSVFLKIGFIGLIWTASAPLFATEQQNQDISFDQLFNLNMEEISQAVGIRASITRSLTQKMNADNISDTIASEDLGKFPDANIAHSLSHVTGVSVARLPGGEARFINVRGLGEQFNTVTFNGRRMATENIGREFSFDVLPSSLIKNATVFKTVSASQTDGSIGGHIDIQTPRPFDFMGRRVSTTLSRNYNVLSRASGTDLSAMFSNTYKDHSIGVLAALHFNHSQVGFDTAESFDTFTVDVDQNGQPFTGAAGQMLTHDNARYTSLAFMSSEQNKERVSGTVVLQWAPNEGSEFRLDWLHSTFKAPTVGYGQTNYPWNQGSLSNIKVAENNVVTEFDLSGDDYAFELITREWVQDTQSNQLGLNGQIQLNQHWDLALDAAYSKAAGIRDHFGSGSNGTGSFYVAGFKNAKARYRYTGSLVPDFSVYVPAYDEDTAGPTGDAVNSPSTVESRLLGAHFTRESSYEVEDKITTFRADLSYEKGQDSYEFGLDWTKRDKSYRLYTNRNSWCHYFCGYQYSLRGLSPEIFDSHISTTDALSGWLNASDGDVIVPALSPQAFRKLYSAVEQGDPVLNSEGEPTGEFHDFTDQSVSSGSEILVATPDPTASSSIRETITAIYGQANVKGKLGSDIPWHGNFGLRLARTSLASAGAHNKVLSITSTDAADQIFTYDEGVAQHKDNDYVSFLPALNLNFQLTKRYLVRTGLSRTISRPTLSQLSASSQIESTNKGVESMVSGNPELEPTGSDNLDLSLEYHGRRRAASVALFYKDISDFITNAVMLEPVLIPDIDGQANVVRNFLVHKPTNGDTARSFGLELSYQQFFDNGFGIMVNTTFANSTATDNGEERDLENASEAMANLSGFYETERYYVHLSASYRSDYVKNWAGLQGLQEVVDDYAQVDLSAGYWFNEQFEAFFQGFNITGENKQIYFKGMKNLLVYYEDGGASYTLGLRGKF